MPVHDKIPHNYKYYFRVIIVLFAIMICTLALRVSWLNQQGIPGDDSVWLFTLTSRFTANDKDATVRLYPPYDTPNARVISQNLQYPDLKVVRFKPNDKASRAIVINSPSSGKRELVSEFRIHISPIRFTSGNSVNNSLSMEDRERFIRNTPELLLDSPLVQSTLEQIQRNNSNPTFLVDEIFHHVYQSIQFDTRATYEDAASILHTHRANAYGRALVMVALCRAARIPARLISGFIIEEKMEAYPHFWVEVYDEKSWIPYDIENRFQGNIPYNYIPFRKELGSIIAGDRISDLEAEYEITQDMVSAGLLSNNEKNFFDVFDYSRLPLDARSALALLMLLPLGALLTTAFRNIVGIRSFGTFTPTLTALAAVYADWVTAIIIFSIVVTIGVFGRSLMPEKMNRAPRLTIVFTIVALSMTFSVSLMDYYDLNPAGHILLLPIVILTSLVDRFYTTSDESGLHIALVRLFWTGVIAILCLLVLQMQTLGFFLLKYPEVHFVTLIASMLIAIYSGKKLTDMAPLKWLAEPGRTRKRDTIKSEEQDL